MAHLNIKKCKNYKFKSNFLVILARPGDNFTNILRAAFMRTDPKSATKGSQLKQLFALFGSVPVKAARKHVDEIDPCSYSKKNY